MPENNQNQEPEQTPQEQPSNEKPDLEPQFFKEAEERDDSKLTNED